MMNERDYYYIALLVVVVVIAFFVNRKRDAQGKISFIDKNKMGVLGVMIQAFEEDVKTGVWFLPLWHPINRLILDVTILLGKGEYGVEVYWENVIHKPLGDMFEKEPPDQKRSVEILSEMRRFRIPGDGPVQFVLKGSGKKLAIDSPTLTSGKAKTDAFPILIEDPDLEKTAVRLQKDKSRKTREILEIPLVDPRISKSVKNKVKTLQHKLDGLIIQNEELKTNLDTAVKGNLKK